MSINVQVNDLTVYFILSIEHERESINCEPPEKRRCELSNEGNISADHIMQNGTGETNADIKTEKASIVLFIKFYFNLNKFVYKS